MKSDELMKLTKKELIERIKALEEAMENLRNENNSFRKGGRPRIEVDEEVQERIRSLYFKKGWGYRKIGEEIGLSHSKIRQLILKMVELKKEEEE